MIDKIVSLLTSKDKANHSLSIELLKAQNIDIEILNRSTRIALFQRVSSYIQSSIKLMLDYFETKQDVVFDIEVLRCNLFIHIHIEKYTYISPNYLVSVEAWENDSLFTICKDGDSIEWNKDNLSKSYRKIYRIVEEFSNRLMQLISK